MVANQWTPKASDIAWQKMTMNLLKIGGVWGCPIGFSMWQKTAKNEVTLLDGPIKKGDSLPDVVPPDMAAEAVSGCIECNRRILTCLKAAGFTVKHEGKTL